MAVGGLVAAVTMSVAMPQLLNPAFFPHSLGRLSHSILDTAAPEYVALLFLSVAFRASYEHPPRLAVMAFLEAAAVGATVGLAIRTIGLAELSLWSARAGLAIFALVVAGVTRSHAEGI
jgi:hypothetical protein